MAIIATGIYAVLLRVPSLPALVETPYGRALTMKLGLLLFLLAAGGINLIGRGKGPFGRMVRLELVLATGIFVAAGFLTSVPPADDVWGVAPTNGDEIGELVLEPVNDSGVEGTATFREITDGVEARLNFRARQSPAQSTWRTSTEAPATLTVEKTPEARKTASRPPRSASSGPCRRFTQDPTAWTLAQRTCSARPSTGCSPAASPSTSTSRARRAHRSCHVAI